MGKEDRSFHSLFRVVCRRKESLQRAVSNRRSRVLAKFYRSVAVICTITLLWFGSAGLQTAPSHASSAAAAAPTTSTLVPKSLTSASLDQIVDRYVKSHMFDDDVYDPVESTYREAVDDKVRGAYPRALKEVTSSVLGQDSVAITKPAVRGARIGNLLVTAAKFVEERAGLSEATAVLILAFVLVGSVPLTFVSLAAITGNFSKRNINKTMKQRYGNTYRYVRPC
jgi:hypothetical protein